MLLILPISSCKLGWDKNLQVMQMLLYYQLSSLIWLIRSEKPGSSEDFKTFAWVVWLVSLQGIVLYEGTKIIISCDDYFIEKAKQLTNL